MFPQNMWTVRDVSAWLLLQGGGFFVPLVLKFAFDLIDGKQLLKMTKDQLNEYGVSKECQQEMFFERLEEDKNEDLQVGKKLKLVEGKEEGAASVVEDWSCEHVLLWLLSMGGVFLSLIEGFEYNRVNGEILSKMDVDDFMAYGLSLVEAKCVRYYLVVKIQNGHNFCENFKRLLIRHAEKKRMEKERLSVSTRSAFDTEYINPLPEGPSLFNNNVTNDADIVISPILVVDENEDRYMKFPSQETDSGYIVLSPLMQRASSIESAVSSIVSVGSTPDSDISFVLSPIMDHALSIEYSRETDNRSEFGEESDVDEQEDFFEAITSRAPEKPPQKPMISIKKPQQPEARFAKMFQQKKQQEQKQPKLLLKKQLPQPNSHQLQPNISQPQPQSQFRRQIQPNISHPQPIQQSRFKSSTQINQIQTNSPHQEPQQDSQEQRQRQEQRRSSFSNSNPQSLRIAQAFDSLSKQKENQDQDEVLETEEEKEEEDEPSFLQFDRKAQPDFDVKGQPDRNRKGHSSSSIQFDRTGQPDLASSFQQNENQEKRIDSSIRIQPAFRNRKIRSVQEPIRRLERPKQMDQLFSRPPLLEQNKNQQQIQLLESDARLQSLSKQFQQIIEGEERKDGHEIQIDQSDQQKKLQRKNRLTKFEVGQLVDDWLQNSGGHEIHKSRMEIQLPSLDQQAPTIQKVQSFALRPTFLTNSARRKEGEMVEQNQGQDEEQALHLRQYLLQATNAVAFYQSMGIQYLQLIQFISLVGTQLIIDVYTLALVAALENNQQNDDFHFPAVAIADGVSEAQKFASHFISGVKMEEENSWACYAERNMLVVC